VGLDVQDSKKMSVALSEEMVHRFDPTIYAEIKDFLFDVETTQLYSKMVAANNDKDMAKKMLKTGEGIPEVLGKMLSYKERLAILKDQIEVGKVPRYLTIDNFFNDREQKEVFKELLKMNNEFALSCLEEHWEYVKYEKVRGKYLAILETAPSTYSKKEIKRHFPTNRKRKLAE